MHLFTASGVELEYMVVDRETLDVRPEADAVLASLAGGSLVSDYEVGSVTWSNELALHVLELKNTVPSDSLSQLEPAFRDALSRLDALLGGMQLRLLPTAMHPWMQPEKEAQLWPHENAEIYRAYDQIFDCHSHGWSNVQSVHLNLPFCGDEEFGRLHAAARLVLPLLPALAASSPVVEGERRETLDTRLGFYADHCHRVPFLTGSLVPEPIYDERSYRRDIYDRMYEAIAPLDPNGTLHGEFLNARGAIARFDRGSIELRVIDVQEYPRVDLAICAATTALLRMLVQQQWSSLESQKSFPTDRLQRILTATAESAEQTLISDTQFLSHFSVGNSPLRAGEVWERLLQRLRTQDEVLDGLFEPLDVILRQGTLATRIRTTLGAEFSPQRLRDVYREIADCLIRWKSFCP